MKPKASRCHEALNEAERFCRSRVKEFRDDGEILDA